MYIEGHDISFFVPGIARTAGSKKIVPNRATGRMKVTHDGKYTKAWMDKVGWYALQEVGRMILLTGALRLECEFLILRPKGHYGTGRNSGQLKPSAPLYPIVKPDLTKMIRAAEDALTGIIWRDDSQVVKFGDMEKRYCLDGESPGALITIKEVNH